MGSALIPQLPERAYSVDVVYASGFGNALSVEAGIVDKDLFEVTVLDLSSVAAWDIAEFPYPHTPRHRTKCAVRVVKNMSMVKLSSRLQSVKILSTLLTDIVVS